MELVRRSILIITACDEERADHIVDTKDSLLKQSLPANWVFKWHVRIDGPHSQHTASKVAGMLSNDRFEVDVSANLVRRGTATTRTMAFYEEEPHGWVLALDADDRLAESALKALTDTIDTAEELPWWISGTTVRFGETDEGPWALAREDLLPFGPVEAGEVVWHANNGVLAPVTPNSVLYRGTLIDMLGGWPALGSCEDLGLLYAASSLKPGLRIDTPVLERRRWDRQVTAPGTDWHHASRNTFVEAALRRARALVEFS